MGQQQTRGNQSVLPLNHSKFSKVVFPKSSRDKEAQTMDVQLACDEVNYKNWKKQLENKQKKLSNKKHLLLPLSHKYSNADLCSRTGITKAAYAKFPYLLQDEILLVEKNKSTFSEPEIWKLLLSIVKAKNQFWQISDDFSNNLGNINPKNIFLNDKSQVKLANPLSWPNYMDGYKNSVLKEVSYLSPQDLKLLQLGALQNQKNKNSQIFSIGMTLLSVGLAQNLQHLYDLQKNQIRNQIFSQKLMFWKTTLYYSQILRAVVLKFLQEDPSQRMNFKEIQDFLRPHEQNIRSQKPLTISNANQNIHKEVQTLRSQVPGLIKYRFEKYPQKQQKINSKLQNSKRQNSKLQGQHINIQNNLHSPRQNHSPYLNHSPNQNHSPQQNNSSQQNSLINRAKSQTRFTYSNVPVNMVSPVKIAPQNASKTEIVVPKTANVHNVRVSENVNNSADKYIDEKINNSTEKQVDIVDQIFPHYNKKVSKKQINANQIAKRLVQQGQGKIKHADSQIQASQTNRQSAQTQITKLYNAMVNPEMKASFQKNQDYEYHTYAQIYVHADFQSTWKEYLKMIEKPDVYFAQIQDKLIATNGTIEIPPGRVQLEANKQEGKIHLMNASSNCKGDILGGVSKNSCNLSQVWFNSSYTHEAKPFPKKQFFTKSLEKLKANLQFMTSIFSQAEQSDSRQYHDLTVFFV